MSQMTFHATAGHPLPGPPRVLSTPEVVARMRRAAHLREVEDEFTHLTRRRSSQALATALLEVEDAYRATRALCPLVDPGTSPVSPEDEVRVHAAQLRLDAAVITAAAAGATTEQIDAATTGARP